MPETMKVGIGEEIENVEIGVEGGEQAP